MVEIQYLGLGVRSEKVPVTLRAVGNPHIAGQRVLAFDMIDLSLHALKKAGLAIFRCGP